jgi:hypothetical protein
MSIYQKCCLKPAPADPQGTGTGSGSAARAQVMDMNCLIPLNDTDACVWELLAEERTPDELAAAVAERFDITPEHACADVQTFLDEIAKLGMLAA